MPPPPPPPPPLPPLQRRQGGPPVPPPPPPPQRTKPAKHVPPPPPPPSFPSENVSLPPPPPQPPSSSNPAPLPPLAPGSSPHHFRISNLPPAPVLPDAPRMSDDGPQPKFPSFTMDLDAPDLTDITNKRNSLYTSRHASGKPWDKPLDCDTMTTTPISDDEETEHFDVPDRLTIGPGAAAARLDLQRCTIRVHKQLVDQIKTHSMKPSQVVDNAPTELSRCQGELWLKSRLPMVGWKKRYGSIVDHSFFGPVLFLFKYDAKGNVALHHSMMIVLVDSQVRLGKNSTTKDKDYRCEFVLKTTKRRYTIAANHTMRRDYWLRNLEMIQRDASTHYS